MENPVMENPIMEYPINQGASLLRSSGLKKIRKGEEPIVFHYPCIPQESKDDSELAPPHQLAILIQPINPLEFFIKAKYAVGPFLCHDAHVGLKADIGAPVVPVVQQHPTL